MSANDRSHTLEKVTFKQQTHFKDILRIMNIQIKEIFKTTYFNAVFFEYCDNNIFDGVCDRISNAVYGRCRT